MQTCSVILGVTTVSPEKWWEELGFLDKSQTWRLYTEGGFTTNGHHNDIDLRWIDQIGRNDLLSVGDVLTISLCYDRSVSIIYNDMEFLEVFTDLPDKPLWAVINMGVTKMESLQLGNYNIFRFLSWFMFLALVLFNERYTSLVDQSIKVCLNL